MLSTLRNAWKVKDIRGKIVFTLLMLVVFRIGNFIPVPGVNKEALMSVMDNNSNNLLGFYDLMNGGALKQSSIFALGVMPYINTSIIMQLLTVAIPHLENLSKEGDDGRKKIQKYTKYVSVVFAVIQSYGIYAIMTQLGAINDYSKFNIAMIMLTLTAGSVFLVWLGDQITVKGFGNGVSLIIAFGIISSLPDSVLRINSQVANDQVTPLEVIVLGAILLALLISVIVMTLAERRIPIQYASKANGRHFKQNSNLPFNLTASVVISIIFAMSFMKLPSTIASFFPNSTFAVWMGSTKWFNIFNYNSAAYNITYIVLIIFFTWFYTQIIYKADEMAENIHKSAGFIPGVRPGEDTRLHIEKVLSRVSIIAGTFAAIVALFPLVLESSTNFKNLSLGGTALLILVSVSIETVKTLESQLVMRHYGGFLKR